ncbi:MAG TPA: hypothetical protein VKB36_18070 [Vicinamibacterales bacterium]|nr:hypothetical protein [Vicinamibacterales bacterium]
MIRRLHSSKSLSCGANSAWQQLSVLAHNQLDAGAEPKRRSRKRTYAFLFRSMRTLRFLVIARAGRVVRIGGRTRLRLVQNPGVQSLYERDSTVVHHFDLAPSSPPPPRATLRAMARPKRPADFAQRAKLIVDMTNRQSWP